MSFPVGVRDLHAEETRRNDLRKGNDTYPTVKTILSQLKFDPLAEVTVSFSGGMFKAGDLILKPSKDYPLVLFERLKEQQAEGALSEPVRVGA
ncbi:MAG: hypothetical protein GX335_00170 [Firmicutes bacterium]|nr:hypothetical protein [Bacillota bacterium]